MATDKEIIDCIQLINSENIGPVTFYKLLETYGTVSEALAKLPSLQKFKLFPRRKAELEYRLAQEKHINILLYTDKDYPELLRQIEDAPPLLYVTGKAEYLNNPLSLSIVGARNATINGRKTASRIAFELTNNQVMIVSGMARGIDTAAHRGAMHALEQCGPTIAVLGCGVDVVYPKENQELYQQIIRQGAIVSEFPLGTLPQSNNFPRRNRIVAALSLGTLVVEATLNSGSLITARLALEQGKDIFAIPGSPNEARSEGPNHLIKEGAVLVENAQDILNILFLNNSQRVKEQLKLGVFNHEIKPTGSEQKQLFSNNNEMFVPPPLKNEISLNEDIPSTKIIDYLNHDGVYVDEIIRASGMDAATVSLELLELEMSGRIERQAGNKVALIK